MNDRRRRIDLVLEPEYLRDLDQLELEELRARRDTAEDVESQISYYRRLLHGRMDLLSFEAKRRSGEESRCLIDALPEILARGLVLGQEPTARHIEVMPPIPSTTGRRLIDQIMDDGVLTRLPDMTDAEVAEALDRLKEIEVELSQQRRQLHAVIDALQTEIDGLYRSQQDEATVSG